MEGKRQQVKSNKTLFTSPSPLSPLLLLALIAALPLWGPGLVNTRGGGDSPFLLWRVHQLAANLSDGIFPARWMPDATYGLGYPFFNYYAALPFYLAAFFNRVGLDILTAIKLTQTLGFILAALTSYGWFRRVFSSQAAAWLGAAAYIFAPFHLVNVYVRGDSLAEFYAFAFYPLILWAIDNATRQPALENVIALGLTYSGLIITHTLSSALFSPFILLYAIVQILIPPYPLSTIHYPLPHRRASITALIAGLILGLALSAWYWLPAALETGYVQPATLQQGYFNYSGHFRSLNLVQPSFWFIYDTTSAHASPFAMGLAQAILAGLGTICYLVLGIGYSRARNTQYPIPFLLLATFMITPLSKPLWDHLPILPMAQFPWRFLSIQALFAAMVTALLVESIPRWRAGAAIIMAAMLISSVMLPLRPERLPISAGDVTIERLQLYELFTANIGTTITYEWLPHDVIPRPYVSEQVADPTAPPRAFATNGELIAAREILRRATWRLWQIETASDATLVFPLLYWPGWSAAIDGQPTHVHAAHSSGRVALNVPAGQHTIELRLERTPVRLAAEIISLLALAACAALSTRHAIRHAHCPLSNTQHAIPHITLVLAALLLLIAYDRRSPINAGNATMDFIQMPYLHGGQIHFATAQGRNSLDGYRISSQSIAAGQAISLTLGWTANAPLTVTVSLVGMSEHLFDLNAPIILSQASSRMDSITNFTLQAPSDLPTGVYLIQVRVEDAKGEIASQTANGTTLGRIYLQPVYIHNRRPIGNEPILATFGDRIHLHAVNAEQLSPSQLLVKLDWSVSKGIAENYSIAVRLYNAQGDRLAAIDTQPGHGFLPTVTWRPGEKITDRLMLPLPDGLPPRNDYRLEIILYDLANNLAGIGQYFQSGIALTHYTRRSADLPVLATFGPQLALATLDAPPTHPQGAPALSFTAGWLATAQPDADVSTRWSLIDEAGNVVAAQTVRLETSRWPAGAYMRDIVHLPTPPGTSAGRYHLAIVMFDAQGERGRAQLEQAIEVTGRARSFEIPPLDHHAGIKLGNVIELEGYNLTREQDALRLMLVWRAQQAMSTDYTIFVHLLDASGAIARQYDAMPLGNTYPTSWWAMGEVVSDVVTLALKDLPPGVYHLAVGMYDGATLTRLAAYQPDGQRLPDDRLILTQAIRVDSR